MDATTKTYLALQKQVARAQKEACFAQPDTDTDDDRPYLERAREVMQQHYNRQRQR